MAYYFHKDRELYFQHQRLTTKNYIIPFIDKHYKIKSGMDVLEIGCGEGGVIKAFADLGCVCSGVELNDEKYKMAAHMLTEEIGREQVKLIHKNIYDPEFKSRFQGQFDLIILKDVIEHIPDQQKLLGYLHTFLRKNGVIFFAFPPWQMPFGGHQQMCESFLKKTPWFHLLPMPMYKLILKTMREPQKIIDGLIANKKTGISIERFERILRKTGYREIEKTSYLFNPIYKYKFHLSPKEQYKLLSKLPYIRNFLTTAIYCLVKFTGKE